MSWPTQKIHADNIEITICVVCRQIVRENQTCYEFQLGGKKKYHKHKLTISLSEYLRGDFKK